MSAEQEYRLVIDLDKTTPQTKPKNDLYQGDKEANVVVLELVRKGAPVTLEGYTARGSMERSDGSQVPCEGAVAGNVVRITLNEHCYVYAGPYKLDIELDGGGMRRTMAQIHGVVQQTAQGPTVNINESIVDVDAVIALYGEMKTAKDEAVKATTAANDAAADANSAADRANNAAQSIEGLTVSASPGAAPDAEITEEDGVKRIHFTLQTGATPDITFEVATGAPGTQVHVQQSGTPEAPTVKLTIPRGDTGAVDGIDYFEGDPSALGTASPGTANGVARGDHVHPMPTAAQVGARPDSWIPTSSDVGALAADGTAADASKLGGKPAAYYGGKPVLLWENASPSSEYPPQSQNANFAQGKTYLFVFGNTFFTRWGKSVIVHKQDEQLINFDITEVSVNDGASRYGKIMRRNLSIYGDRFEVSNCYAADSYGVAIATIANNNLIPLFVYEML